jgi:hypothetical protein
MTLVCVLPNRRPHKEVLVWDFEHTNEINTFEAYCGERQVDNSSDTGYTRDVVGKALGVSGITYQRAKHVVDAAAVGELMSTDVDKPTNEGQARALLANLTPDEREQVRKGTSPLRVTRPERRSNSRAFCATPFYVVFLYADFELFINGPPCQHPA